jgi:hypothetical protein
MIFQRAGSYQAGNGQRGKDEEDVKGISHRWEFPSCDGRRKKMLQAYFTYL